MSNILYPTRASAIPGIRKTRIKEMSTIIGGEEEGHEQFELTYKEFLMLASLYQINFNYLVYFLDLVIRHGGMVVCVSYVFLTGMLGMPLFMLFTFMSSYSKKSYMKFWDCVPLFEGLGYSLAVIRLTTELYNTTAAGLSLMLIPDLFHKREMDKLKSCGHHSEYDNHCMPMYPTSEYTSDCTLGTRDNNTLNFTATQYYVRFISMKYDYLESKCCTTNQSWLINVAFTWMLIFIFAIHGIRRIRQITTSLQLVFASILLCISVIAIFHVSTTNRVSLLALRGEGALWKFNFWVEMILHSAEVNVLGNMIWLGTLKPKKLNPKYAAIITSPVKLLVFILTVCLSSLIIEEHITHYKIKDHRCLIVTGHDVIFAFIPDVLHRTKIVGLLNLFWYLGIFYFAFVSPLYTIIGLVETLTQKYKKLSQYRLYVYIVICLLGFLTNITLVQNYSSVIMDNWRYFGIPLLTATMLLLVNLAVLFVYSAKQVIDDYTFTYGSPPEKYWVALWKSSPIFAIFVFIFVLNHIKRSERSIIQNNVVLASSYVQCSLVILPIFGIFITRCCRHVKYRTLRSLSKPSDEWGPYGEAQKVARRYFYPQRDIKYRNDVLKCKHKCVVSDSSRYYEEVRIQTEKLEILKKEMEEYKKQKEI